MRRQRSGRQIHCLLVRVFVTENEVEIEAVAEVGVWVVLRRYSFHRGERGHQRLTNGLKRRVSSPEYSWAVRYIWVTAGWNEMDRLRL